MDKSRNSKLSSVTSPKSSKMRDVIGGKRKKRSSFNVKDDDAEL